MFGRLDKTRRETVAEEPQHWSTERMIQEGRFPEYATHSDFTNASDEVLLKVAELCLVPTADEDACIPCWAYAVFMERQEKRLEDMNPPSSVDDGTEEFPETPATSEWGRTEENMTSLEAEVSDQTDRLDVLHEQGQEPAPQGHRAEHLLTVVRQLEALLEEVLHGPPIPPKDVSLAELGLLVLAADKWVKITEVQGTDLSPSQRTMLDSTKDLVARLRP
jgi:hypothetical protein